MRSHNASMSGQLTSAGFASWATLQVPVVDSPGLLMVRAQSIPAKSYFPGHEHGWGQLVYAVSGVLNVWVEGRCLAISPDQTVWLPSGTHHSVGSLHGAEFRSLYVTEGPLTRMVAGTKVLGVSHLLRELVIEATALAEREDLASAYGTRVVELILASLGRLAPIASSLPWPRGGPLATLCEALYANPADERGQEAWADSLAMSARTLARRCDEELGMSLRDWRLRMRLFRAMELLGSGANVTETAFSVGYASTSAFIYMFREMTGQSPRQYAGKGQSEVARSCAFQQPASARSATSQNHRTPSGRASSLKS